MNMFEQSKINEIKFSVIIPCYNCESFLIDCLDSIFQNELSNDIFFEVILINDGSTDNSLDIMKEYQNKKNNITIHDQANHGVSTARNKGISLAKGQYICFIDADDWIEKDYFESLKSCLNNLPDIIEFGYFTDKNDESIPSKNNRNLGNREKIEAFLVTTSQQEGFWFCYTRAFRREFLINNNLQFNKSVKLGEDGLFILESFNLAKKIVNIRKHLYHIRINNQSVTQIKFKPNLLNQIENQFAIRKNIHLSNIDKKLINKDLANYYVNHSLMLLLNNAANNPEKSFFKKEISLIRDSKIYKDLFSYYNYDWSSPKRSLIVKLFEKRQFLILEKVLRVIYS